jgi:hypothetical protein
MITSDLTTSRIDSIGSLHAHLQTALQLEHATIPPYFTAWLSANESKNREASQIIRSVMLEEMLHLTLVANIFNAVGGHPSLTGDSFVPSYPEALPHSGRKFLVSIEKFSPQALETFLKVELPEAVDAEPEPGEYKTIGQFYSAIADGIRRLCSTLGEDAVFVGAPDLQLRPEDYYGAGNLVVVRDCASALKAIAEIKEQGEGTGKSLFDLDEVIWGPGPGSEPAHYFRFKELLLGMRYQRGDTLRSGPTGPPIKVQFEDAYSIAMNPKVSDYDLGSPIRTALEAFCDSYGCLLADLESAFNGKREQLIETMARMFALKNQALALMRTPISPTSETTVGLAFTRR